MPLIFSNHRLSEYYSRSQRSPLYVVRIIVSDLMPMVNDPEALVRAVKEAAIRTDVSTVENVLIPLTNKTNELSAKVIELAGQYDAGNYGDIKVRAVSNFDKTVDVLTKHQKF